MGNDPLRWIRDTSAEEPQSPEATPEDEGVLGTVSKVQELPDTAGEQAGSPSRPGKTSKPGKTRRPNSFGNTDNISNSDNPSKLRKGTETKAEAPVRWIRATMIARTNYLEMLKALAYLDRKPLKDVFDDALTTYFKSRAADLNEAQPLYKRKVTK